jgi:hypothetical protein
MNIDERLTAITINMEVMSGMLKDLIKAHEDNERWMVLLTKLVAKHDEILDKGEATE